MTESTIQVLVVDDHDIVRQGLRALLSEYEDIEVVGEAVNGLEAIQEVERLKPDVVLMDLVMPEMDGIEAIGHITDEYSNVRILVITTFSSEDLVFPAIKAGAHGYLLKDSGSSQVEEAIRHVHKGEPSLHPDIARMLMQEVRPEKPNGAATDPLTPRELEVLSMLARGMSNKEIAEELVIAEVTVRSHISRILDKLHLANRVQATLYALREGMVDLDENS
jgi:NarL family two-component system response regulator LiaR